ncbi:MAG: hypothetical protein R3191_01655 [Anaerolineales bacterium]|nr:hypothetical protein [Anaerolineales bacterium]
MERYPSREEVRYGPRGKYFTEVIGKEPQRVEIRTPQGRIEGVIHVHPDHRLLDEINEGPPFLAVTDVRLHHEDSIVESSFLALNRSQVLWVMPVETDEGEPHGD